MNIKEYLQYNKDTGEFTWIKKTSSKSRVKIGNVAGWEYEGYIHIEFNNVKYKAHRLAWFYEYGEWVNIIDHINGIRNDNRIENLRSVTSSENSLNRKYHRDNSRELLNIYYRKSKGFYEVIFRRGQKNHYIGGSKNLNTAINIRNDYLTSININDNINTCKVDLCNL